jgi:hypothetical protein
LDRKRKQFAGKRVDHTIVGTVGNQAADVVGSVEPCPRRPYQEVLERILAQFDVRWSRWHVVGSPVGKGVPT